MFVAIKTSALLGKKCIVTLKQIFIHRSVLHQIKVVFKKGSKGKMRTFSKGRLKVNKKDKPSSLP